MIFYADWASAVSGAVYRVDENAMNAVAVEEANLLRALRLTEMREH